MSPGSMPKFAFLLLKEHPYGREMLSQLLSENFIPSIIVSEDSKVGDEEREKFLKRIEGNPVAPTIESQIAELAEGADVQPSAVMRFSGSIASSFRSRSLAIGSRLPNFSSKRFWNLREVCERMRS